MTRTLALTLAFLAAPPTNAAELVLYGPEGTADTARAKVALFGGRTLANLQARTLTELVTGEEILVVGGATLTPCSGDPGTNAAIAELLVEAESAVQFMEFESASTHLENAVSVEQCLTEPLDAAQASRVHYLMGMVAVGSGDPGSAWPQFLQAALLNPEITWDENFPPDGQTAFKGAVAATAVAEPQPLRLVPPHTTPVWVDGTSVENAAELMLKPGMHIVQMGEAELVTWTLELPEATNAALVDPTRIEDAQVNWASDPSTRGQLEALLAHNSQGAITYVSLPGQVLWQFEPATGVWSGLSGVTEAETPAESDAVADAAALPSTGAKQNRRTLYLASGGGLVVAGGSMLGIALASKKAVGATGDELHPFENQDEVEQYQNRANTLGVLGYGSTALGAGLLGLGILSDTSLGITWNF